jgi:hypothetical protein
VGIGGVAGVAGETELVARLDDGAGMGESRIEAAGLHVGIEDDDITMLDEVVVAGAIGNGRGELAEDGVGRDAIDNHHDGAIGNGADGFAPDAPVFILRAIGAGKDLAPLVGVGVEGLDADVMSVDLGAIAAIGPVDGAGDDVFADAEVGLMEGEEEAGGAGGGDVGGEVEGDVGGRGEVIAGDAHRDLGAGGSGQEDFVIGVTVDDAVGPELGVAGGDIETGDCPRVRKGVRRVGETLQEMLVGFLSYGLGLPKNFIASHMDVLTGTDFFTVEVLTLNAFAERWVRSIKQECLSKLILFGETSLRRALTEYIDHHHFERNHQGKNNLLLFSSLAGPPSSTRRNVRCRERLRGRLGFTPMTFDSLTLRPANRTSRLPDSRH